MKEQMLHSQIFNLMIPLQDALSCTKIAFGGANCNFVQAGLRVVATFDRAKSEEVHFEVSFESTGLQSCQLCLTARNAQNSAASNRQLKAMCRDILCAIEAEERKLTVTLVLVA